MAYRNVQFLRRNWNCIGEAERAAAIEMSAYAHTPPYIMAEDTAKFYFALEYGSAFEQYYDAWRGAWGIKIVTRTFGGQQITGIDCQTGVAPLVWNCRVQGGCAAADPCDCEQWFWRNKPSPCAGS